MAGIVAIASTPSEVSVVAATPKTVLRIKAAANHRVKALGWGIFFDGVLGTSEPVVVRLLRSSTDGTYTSVTPVPLDEGVAETIQTTAGHTATAEGTAGNVVDRVEVHPQSGFAMVYPPGQEIVLISGGRLGIEVTVPTGGATINCHAYIKFEE